MSKGISNIQIEKRFREPNDQDIDENFVGVFPANHMNRLINYKTMISEKKESIPLSSQTRIALARMALAGEA